MKHKIKSQRTMTFSYRVNYSPTPEFVDSWVGGVRAEEREGARA